jgi:hypothetical protein
MLITYIGRHSEGVFVPDGSGGEIFIEHGASVVVPDEIAEALCDEQPDSFVPDVAKPARKLTKES